MTENQHQWLSTSEAAKLTPYNAEYLSLLARKKRLPAKKIGKNWFTTRMAVEEYMRRQMMRANITNGVKDETHENGKTETPEKILHQLDYIREKMSHGLLRKIGEEKKLEISPAFVEELEKLSQSLSGSFGDLSKNLEKIAALKKEEVAIEGAKEEARGKESLVVEKYANTLFGKFINKFTTFLDVSVEKHFGIFHRAWRFVKESYKSVVSHPTLFLFFLAISILLMIFPVRFIFGFFDDTIHYAFNKMKDAQTVLGFRPGTHANEILLLDKKGNVSIFGNIETEGQFQSFAKEGIAPIIVESITKVENLNADYLDGVHAEEFTLAYVTKNGNITAEDVYFEGKVEVGRLLLVKGATKLLSTLEIDGELTAFGDAKFKKSITVDGPAYFNALLNAKDINANGTITGNIISGLLIGGPRIMASQLLSSEGNFYVKGQSTFDGFAFFSSGLQARSGDFELSLGVGGDFSASGNVRLGKITKEASIVSKNWSITVAGAASLASLSAGEGTISSFTATIASTTNLSASGYFSLNGALYDSDASAGSNGMVLQTTGSVTQWAATSSLGIIGIPGGLDTQIQFNDGGTIFAGDTDFTWNKTANLLTISGNASTTQLTTTGSTYLATTGGNVGIGTASPRVTLQIQGDLSLSGSFLKNNQAVRIPYNYVSAANASSYLTTPTYDGSGQAIHPDIYYNPLKWPNQNGYKYWMAMTPYPSNALYENPSILVSNNGQSWSVPSGLTNPIDTPSTGNDADTDIIEGPDGKLYVFFIWSSPSYVSKIYVKSSADGISWSDKTELLSSSTESFMSPAVIPEGGGYVMYTVDFWPTHPTLNRRTASQLTGPWSAPTLCNVTGLPSNRDLWHFNVVKDGDEYHAFVTVGITGANNGYALYFATSQDGINWSLNPTPILSPSTSGWDNLDIYRSTAVLLDEGYAHKYALWYSAQNTSHAWHIGYTEVNLGVVVENNGNVGIGTTNPLTKLSIQGTAGANDVLNVASSTGASMLYVNASGNVGIGTTGPNDKLEIIGNARNSQGQLMVRELTINGAIIGVDVVSDSPAGFLFKEDDVSKWILAHRADIDDSFRLYSYDKGDYVFTINTSGNVGIGTTSPWAKLAVNPNGITGPSFVIGSSTATNFIVTNGGNVGIGTTDPGKNLHIGGGGQTPTLGTDYGGVYVNPSTAYAQMVLENSSGVEGGFVAYSTTQFQIGSLSNTELRFLVNNNDKMVLTTGGLLGIGEMTPGSSLSVKGGVSIGETTDYSQTAAPTGGMIIKGNVGIGTTTPFAKLSIHANSTETNRNLFAVASSTASATTTHFVITNTGNVGIGTTGPWDKLTVHGGDISVTGGDIRIGTGSATTTLTVSSSAFAITANATTTLGTTGLAIGTNQFVVQQTSGNVGIGTTEPGYKLEVRGPANSADIAWGDANNLENFLGYDSGTDTGWWANKYSGGNLAFRLGGVTSSDTKIMILSGGNVGIGTTTPAGLLNIASTLPYLYLTDTNATTNNKHWFLENNAGVLSFGTTTDALSVSGTRALSITNTGNVGIGTTNPGATLHILSADTTQILLTGAESYAAIDFRAYGRSITSSKIQATEGSTANSGALLFQTKTGTGSLTNQLVIDENGNVGIGTTTPSAPLHVWGTDRVADFGRDGVGQNWIRLFGTNSDTYIEADSNDAYFTTNATHAAAGWTIPVSTFSSWAIEMTSENTSGEKFTIYHSDQSSATFNERFTIDESGNVGIGTTSPTVKFSVGGNVGDTTGHGYFTGGLGIGIATTTSGTLQTSGNVYVGGALTVVGSLASSITTGQIQFLANPTGTNIYEGGVYINPSSAGTNNVLLGVAVNGTEKVRIDAEGDIQIVGLFSSTNAGENQFSGDFSVLGHTTLGNASADTVTFNASVASAILPNADLTYDLGSADFRWSNIYAGTTTIDNLVAGGTASSTFIINTDNITDDAEDATLEFERGIATPNAILKWDSTNKRFDFNDFPVRLQNKLIVSGTASSSIAGPVWFVGDSQGTNLQDAVVYINPSSAGAADYALFSVAVNDNERFRIDNEGDTTIQASLGIENQLYDITQDTLTINDSLQVSGNNIKDSAGNTRITLGSTNTLTGNLTATDNFIAQGYGPHYFENGDVGIGYAAPWDKLTVAGDISLTGGDFRLGTGSATTTLTVSSSAFAITANATTTLGTTGLAIGTDQFVVQQTSGNVGIGTTTPWGKLSVDLGSGATPAFVVGDETSPDSTPFIIDASGNVGIGTTTPWAKLAVNPVAGDTNQFVVGSSTATSFVITPAGNVGIGTAEPGAMLDVSQLVYGANTNVMISSETDGENHLIFNHATLKKTAIVSDGLNNFGRSDLYFVVDSAQDANPYDKSVDTKMIIKNNGNVGIGTTSPWAKLAVNPVAGDTNQFVVGSSTATSFVITPSGNVGIGTTNPQTSFWVHLSTDTNFGMRYRGGSVAQLFAGGDDFTNYGYAKLSIDGTTLSLNSESGGNVGIGTTSPWGLLAVEQGTETNSFVVSNTGSSTPSLVVRGVNGNGYVGIGFAGPRASLEVNAANVGVNTTPLYVSNDDGNDTDSVSIRFNVGNGISRIRGYRPTGSYGELFFETSMDAGASFNTGMVLKTSGNVGIGTTTPAYKLTINASDATTNLFQIATTTNQGIFVINNNGNVGIGKTTEASNKVDIWAPNATLAYTGGANLVISSTDAYPSVAGQGGTIGFGGYYSGVNWSMYGVIKGAYEDTLVNAGYLAFYTLPGTGEPTEYMRITSTGNIGIGNISPNEKLNVQGTIAGQIFTATSTTATSTFAGGLAIETSGFVYDWQTNNVGIGTTSPASLLSVHGNAYFSGNITNVSSITATGTLAVSGAATSTFGTGGFTIGTDKFVVQQTSGNVGIATTSPWKKLSVSGDMVLTGALYDSTASAGTENYVLKSTGSATEWVATSTFFTVGSDILPGGTEGEMLYNNAGLWTAFSEMHWDDSDSRLGIGTTTPFGLLHIASTLPYFYITDTNAGTNNKHWFIENNAGVLSFGTTTDALSVSNTRALSILNSGYIGINTTNPSSFLQVVGTSTTGTVVKIISGGPGDIGDSPGLEFNYGGQGAGLGNIARIMAVTQSGGGGDILFQTAADLNDPYLTKMILQKDGNVGIGTTSPNQKLTIFNSAADSALEFSSASGADYKWTMGLDYTDGSFRIASSSALGTSDRFVINGSGNVGIGTTDPGAYKLKVIGGKIYTDTQGTAVGEVITAGRTLTAGSGLTGGGDLTTDRTFAVGEGTCITVNADDVAVTTTGCKTNWDTAYTHSTTDADTSASNEIQTLGTSGNTITLTSGGSVTAPYANSAGSITGQGALATLNSVGTGRINTAAGSASGSITAQSYANITMNDYSFFPNLQDIATGCTNVMGFYSTDSGTTIGRFRLNNMCDFSINYITRWRYITASDHPTIWLIANSDNSITGVWESEDPVQPSKYPENPNPLEGSDLAVGQRFVSVEPLSIGEIEFLYAGFSLEDREAIFTSLKEYIVEKREWLKRFDSLADISLISSRYEPSARFWAMRFVAEHYGIDPAGFIQGMMTVSGDKLAVKPNVSQAIRDYFSRKQRLLEAQEQEKARQAAIPVAVRKADIAEWYSVQAGNSDLEAGEIVSVGSPDNYGFIGWSTVAYDPNILGVISTDSQQIIGIRSASDDVKIALSGRVPVLVTTEGGPISRGDRITSSSIPGVGMKATKSGPTIGIALESFDGTLPDGSYSSEGKILVFLNLGYSRISPKIADGELQEGAFTDIDSIYSRYFSTSTPAMTIDEIGNVGIGTTSLGHKLEVAGEVGAEAFINISTQEAKKDIVYIKKENEEDILKKILSTELATYYYNNEDMTTGSRRLGLIAENAPPEVLSADAKGVDLYKMASFTWGGLKALSNKVDNLFSENYKSAGEQMEIGDIVKISNSDIASQNIIIERATSSEQVIGVVSGNNPDPSAVFLNSVAFSGKQIIKVNLERGEIKAGDKISLSATPGVAAKATSSGQTIGFALENFSGVVFTSTDGSVTYDKSAVGKILVFVNLGYSKLDRQIAGGEVILDGQGESSFWGIDESSGRIKFIGAIDINDFDIIGVKAIYGWRGMWSIDENGKLMAKEIETEKLVAKTSVQIGTREKPIGMTIYQMGSGEPICVYAEGGILKSVSGECGQEVPTGSGSSGTASALELPDNNSATSTPGVDVAESTAGQADNTATSTIPMPPAENSEEAEGVSLPAGEAGTPTESVGAASFDIVSPNTDVAATPLIEPVIEDTATTAQISATEVNLSSN